MTHQELPGADFSLRFKTGKGGRKGEGEDWEEEEEEEDVAIRLSSRDPSQPRAMIRWEVLSASGSLSGSREDLNPPAKMLFMTHILLCLKICNSKTV